MCVQTEDKITSTTTGNGFLELSNLTFSIYGGYILRPIFHPEFPQDNTAHSHFYPAQKAGSKSGKDLSPVYPPGLPKRGLN